MALPELIANSPVPGSRTPLTTLAAAVTDPAALTFTMTGAAPAALQGVGQFRTVLDSEVVIFNAAQVSTTTWTALERHAEGSAPATHLLNANVFHYLTAGALGAMFLLTAWDAGTFYPVGKRVVRANAVFECIQAHTNHDPFTDCATVLSGTYWEFVSLRGAVENYVSGAETVTATSLTLAPTPDQATVFCPGGLLSWVFSEQWKLTGSPIGASSAQVQVDGATVNVPANNGGSNAEGTAALAATGVFWGVANAIGNFGSGGLQAGASTSADANIVSQPYQVNQGGNAPAIALPVVPGVHTVSILYAAGNITTTVNVRDRRLKAFGQ